MKKIFILLSLILLSSPVLSQEYTEDQYPEMDPAAIDGGEFSNQRGLPASDFEEVPREEQVYDPEQNYMDEAAPEEVYEADEEFLE